MFKTPPPQAFDALAPTYDADFTRSAIARHLRDRTHERLLAHLKAGDRILELGCGTGEDARFLGERGYAVTATDASPAMLDAARAKCAPLATVEFAGLDLNHLTSQPPLHPDGEGESALQSPFVPSFALAFANFGVVNCVIDLAGFAGWLAARIRPGGTACFAVMSPLCLWEIGWQGIHGNFRTAFRRLRADTTFEPPQGEGDHEADAIAIRYPSVRMMSRAFAPYFRRTHVEPLGVFLPPSDVYGMVERRPRLLRALMRLDRTTERAGWLANTADHYWIEFERG